MKILFKILLLMVVVIPCQAQKVKPALKLTPGQTYYTISNTNSTITQTINGQSNDITLGMSAKTAFKVLDVKDTVYHLEVTYQTIGMKMGSAGGNMEINSDKKDATDLPSQIFAAMVNKPFAVTISKSGKVLEVEKIDRIMNAIFSTMPKLDSAQKLQLSAMVTQSFGEKAFKSNLAATLAIYPDVKVAKGDKWMINTQVESVMTADVHTSYQLVDIMPDSYIIHGEATIKSLNTADSKVNGMPVQYNLGGTMVTDIKADKVTGWVLEAKLKQDIKGSFEIKDNPQVPGGMVVPMTVHSESITTDR